MEERYKDQFEKAVIGWLDEVDKQTKKSREHLKEIQDTYWK